MATLSAVIITRNEQANIVAAIESVRFADQVVVADTDSQDNTVDLARRAGAEVHSIPFHGFGPAKNSALELCRGDWILSIDADERVSPELARSIVAAINSEDGNRCYSFNRLTYFLGKPVRHSGWHPDYVNRLFRRDLRFSEKSVHESLDIDFKPASIPGLLWHYSYSNLHQYIEKLNLYTTLSAGEMFRSGRRGRMLDLFIRPPAMFLKMYIIKLGFLDGWTGFVLAVLSSYHVFVKYAKLRQLAKKP